MVPTHKKQDWPDQKIRDIPDKCSLDLQGQSLRAPVWSALLGLCTLTAPDPRRPSQAPSASIS